eukprot:CAMPEP_0119267350 /NCGR_PEP_ID=MMETSP1329-20130426/5531_1 /TAXON_ID=114041 /ORGANISM="Genus nov. species nov., Strain RCC1024" /LENGTH=231 /DNA_ID=CAMNT_0007267271 /DNA_START=181 /DNA_END=872 /DNA_ORIENTATION=-
MAPSSPHLEELPGRRRTGVGADLKETPFGSRLLGDAAFLACRLGALAWLAGAGIYLELVKPWRASRPPLIYLTNWGLFAVFVHYLAASFGLAAALAGRPVGAGAARGIFAVALVVEPLIVAGFWALVFPTDQDGCDFPGCYTVHVICCAFMLGDACLNTFVLEVRPHLAAALAYPVAWLATQAAWVHTGHAPDYTVLTLRSWTSIPVICGGTIFVVATFFAARGLCRLRDR